MRKVAQWYLRNPFRLLLEPVYGISIGIIQAPDVLADGRVDHCDSCPDVCVWNGQLVNSCRLDEYRKFGKLMQTLPKGEAIGEPVPAGVREGAEVRATDVEVSSN